MGLYIFIGEFEEGECEGQRERERERRDREKEGGECVGVGVGVGDLYCKNMGLAISRRLVVPFAPTVQHWLCENGKSISFENQNLNFKILLFVYRG